MADSASVPADRSPARLVEDHPMTLTAYNGVAIPEFLYGTAWKKDATRMLVERAVAAGFRGIDTANQLIHYNEVGVGEALERVWTGGLRREDFFLQTKFTPMGGQDHRTPYDRSASLATQVAQSFESSLAHLHTDHLDSYVLHGPHSRRGLTAEDWEVWEAIEKLYEAGKTRMIGVSNVTSEQLSMLCERARTKPMVVQNRCYAVTGWDHAVRSIARAQKILYQGFSLLTANLDVLEDPAFLAIARRAGATPAQAVFRFALGIGMLPLTGTSSETHMKEDLAAGRLALSAQDLAQIEAIAV
jgi:diketogulonate reductase-like aldo/keto reductase